MVLPHPRLERFEVERLRLTALEAFIDRLLQSFDRLRALLVAADKMADIIAGIAEAAILQACFNPGLHRIGKRNIHRCHSNPPSWTKPIIECQMLSKKMTKIAILPAPMSFARAPHCGGLREMHHTGNLVRKMKVRRELLLARPSRRVS